jgi:hypothetical protein
MGTGPVAAGLIGGAFLLSAALFAIVSLRNSAANPGARLPYLRRPPVEAAYTRALSYLATVGGAYGSFVATQLSTYRQLWQPLLALPLGVAAGLLGIIAPTLSHNRRLP